MAESIFSREVSAGLQDLENRYKACRTIFHRARNINSSFSGESETPNATALAVFDFVSGRNVTVNTEEDTPES